MIVLGVVIIIVERLTVAVGVVVVVAIFLLLTYLRFVLNVIGVYDPPA